MEQQWVRVEFFRMAGGGVLCLACLHAPRSQKDSSTLTPITRRLLAALVAGHWVSNSTLIPNFVPNSLRRCGLAHKWLFCYIGNMKVRAIAAWIVLSIGILVLVFALLQSAAFQRCVASDAQYGVEDRRYERPSKVFVPSEVLCVGVFLNENGNALAAIGAFVVAIFTATLWGATADLRSSTDKLWKSAEQQGKDFRRSLEIAEDEVETSRNAIAASIFAGPRSRFGPPDDDGTTRVAINVVNYGQSIGVVTKLCVDSAATAPSGRPENYAYQHNPMVLSYPMQPGQVWSEKNHLMPGAHRFIFGYVEYHDIFGRTLVARFCGRIEQGTYIPEGSEGWNDPGKKRPGGIGQPTSANK